MRKVIIEAVAHTTEIVPLSRKKICGPVTIDTGTEKNCKNWGSRHNRITIGIHNGQWKGVLKQSFEETTVLLQTVIHELDI